MFDLIIYSDKTPDSFTAYMIAKNKLWEKQSETKRKCSERQELVCIHEKKVTQEDIVNKNVLVLAETKLDFSEVSSVQIFNNKNSTFLSEKVWKIFSDKKIPDIILSLKCKTESDMCIVLGGIFQDAFIEEDTWNRLYDTDSYGENYIDICEEIGNSLYISYQRQIVERIFTHENKKYAVGIVHGVFPEIRDFLLKFLVKKNQYDAVADVRYDLDEKVWKVNFAWTKKFEDDHIMSLTCGNLEEYFSGK